MLKKLLTGCLTIVAAAALAVPAMAAEMSGKVGGRAVAELISSSSKASKDADTVSKLDMTAHGRLEYQMAAKEGDWTVTGRFELRSNTPTTEDSTISVLQKYVKLENDAFSVALGKQWWGFVYLTPFLGDTIDRHCYGCGYALNNYYEKISGAKAVDAIEIRENRLIVGIKNVGLQLMVQMNYEDGVKDTTTDNFNETAYGVQYDGKFGPVKVAAAYVSKGTKANIKSSEKTVQDGASFSSMALAVQYAISEAMFVEGDYETESYTSGIAGSKTNTSTVTGLAFAMALSEASGIVAAYDMYSIVYVHPTTGVLLDAIPANRTTINFEQKIAGQKFWVGYASNAITQSTYSIDYSDASIVLGARVNF